MKSKQIMVLLSAACMTFSWAGTPVGAEEDVAGTLAFAQCDSYINIRSDADENSDVVGKIYNNCAATIVEEKDGWYEITSGNATGYVKADYFATGSDAEGIADEVGYHVATVHPEVLMVRSKPDQSSNVVDMAQEAQQLEVVSWDGDWMKVALGGDRYGYINAYYVDYDTHYAVAETLEEENQRLEAEAAAAEAARQEAQAAAEEQQAQQTGENAANAEIAPETEGQYSEYTEPEYVETGYTESYVETEPEYIETEYTEPAYVETEPEYVESEYTEPTYEETESYVEPTYEETEATEAYVETESTDAYVETEASSSDLGQQIANYAVQFVGNPYVYGGTSLTNGADCSGFTQSVMANFGISISRTAADQSCGGTAVDLSDLQAGDLIFYASGGYVGHVALYIGGGQIVHASTESTGIIISNYDYNTPYCARRYWS